MRQSDIVVIQLVKEHNFITIGHQLLEF
jgi:hypothetical protein